MPLSLLPAADTVTLPNCLLSLDEEVQVPAQEAGVLMKIPVREGQQVATGDLLAQIDDIMPQAQYDVAHFKLEVAKKQATDNIDVLYAEAAVPLRRGRRSARDAAANARTPGTVTDEAVDEQRLEQGEVQALDREGQEGPGRRRLAGGVSEAELKAAAANIERRRLIAPLDAVVVELSRHEGEWVQPGDTVMRLVRVDLLRVQGLPQRQGLSALGDPGPAGAGRRDARPRTTARDVPRQDRVRESAGPGGRRVPGAGGSAKPQGRRLLGPQPGPERGNDNPTEITNELATKN